jgi:hypothetical protein
MKGGETGTPASPTPTLDVLTDLPEDDQGDEREFLSIAAGFHLSPIPFSIHTRAVLAQRGQEVWVRIYVDNGVAPQSNCAELMGPTIAHDVSVQAGIWNSWQNRLHVIRVWLYASNATPTWVTDAVAVVTAQSNKLTLVPTLSRQYSEQPSGFRSYPRLK